MRPPPKITFLKKKTNLFPSRFLRFTNTITYTNCNTAQLQQRLTVLHVVLTCCLPAIYELPAKITSAAVLVEISLTPQSGQPLCDLLNLIERKRKINQYCSCSSRDSQSVARDCLWSMIEQFFYY